MPVPSASKRDAGRDSAAGMALRNTAAFPSRPRADKKRSAGIAERAASGLHALCRRTFWLGVCLLFPPTPEFPVFPDDHTQRRIDDMIRSALDKGRVFFDRLRNGFLQLVFAFHHFGWLADDGHGFSFS